MLLSLLGAKGTRDLSRKVRNFSVLSFPCKNCPFVVFVLAANRLSKYEEIFGNLVLAYNRYCTNLQNLKSSTSVYMIWFSCTGHYLVVVVIVVVVVVVIVIDILFLVVLVMCVCVLFCLSFVHLICILAFVLTFSWQLCCWTRMLNRHLLNYVLHIPFILSKENCQISCILLL